MIEMISVSKMFGWLNYMKYQDMAEITSAIFSNSDMSNDTEVNVYLDLGSMVDGLYGNIVEESNDPTELCSVILNLAGHIRAYFRSMHSVYCTIFMVYSPNDWNVLKKICIEYNSRNHKANRVKLNKYIKDTMNIVEQIVSYIPNVYCINTLAETGGVIYDTILRERQNGNDHPNIIFTKEYNLLQIPALDSRSFIYYKQPNSRNRVCFGITKDNVMEWYIKLTKRYNPIFSDPDAIVYIQMIDGDLNKVKFLTKTRRIEELGRILKVFNPRMLPYFIALTNLPSRGLKYILPWSSTMEALYKLDSEFVDDPEWVYNKLEYDTKIFNKIGYEEFINRYHCISIIHQAGLYRSLPFKNYRIDLINSDEIKYLNDHYFIKNYIDLNKF